MPQENEHKADDCNPMIIYRLDGTIDELATFGMLND